MLKLLELLALFAFLFETSKSQEQSESSESSESESGSGSVATTAAAAVINHNNVQSNYYYSNFATVYFPYAIGQCTASGINGYALMATCVDSTHIKIQSYSTGTCTSASLETETTYNSSQAVFKCDGVNTYVRVTIGPLSCTAAVYQVYSALNVCVFSGSAFVSVYCSSTSAELQYYTTPTCTDSSIYTTVTASTTCAALFPLSGTVIYGSTDACNTGPTTAAPVTTATPVTTQASSANNFNVFSILVCLSLFVAWRL